MAASNFFHTRNLITQPNFKILNRLFEARRDNFNFGSNLRYFTLYVKNLTVLHYPQRLDELNV